MVGGYRVDPSTGALIFNRSGEKEKSRQMSMKIEELERRVEELEENQKRLLNMLERRDVYES